MAAPALTDITTDDSVQLYLNEITRYPLLTAAEEVRYGQIIRAGTQFVWRHKRKVAVADAAAHAAHRHLVESNLLLVASVAGRYSHVMPPGGHLLDLIQAGNLGLMQAAWNYDPAHRNAERPGEANRFSTYATWWLRQSVTREISEMRGRSLGVANHQIENYNRYRRLRSRLHVASGQEPTLDEWAAACGVTTTELLGLANALDGMRSLEELAPGVTAVSPGKQETIGDLLEDEHAIAPESVIGPVDIATALSYLTAMECDIITRRYNLDGDGHRSLEEIGKTYRLSHERIRQLEHVALAKLRPILKGA